MRECGLPYGDAQSKFGGEVQAMGRLAFVSVVAAAIGCGALAHADESLIGTYTGSFTGSEQYHFHIGMKLVVSNVDQKGIVKATATVYDGLCAGIYSCKADTRTTSSE
jgi:hypothetical protein